MLAWMEGQERHKLIVPIAGAAAVYLLPSVVHFIN